MKKRNSKTSKIISLLLVCVLLFFGLTQRNTEDKTLEKAELIRVVDGDTLIVKREGSAEERVRLIGVNTPESVHPDETKKLRVWQSCQRVYKRTSG